MAEQSIDKATLPWRWEIPYRWLVGANEVTILHYDDFGNDGITQADGDLLIQGVNSYDSLCAENAVLREACAAARDNVQSAIETGNGAWLERAVELLRAALEVKNG